MELGEYNIECPFCGKAQDFETEYEHTTIHGTEGKLAGQECEFCERIFFVKECVSRYWETFRTEHEEYNQLNKDTIGKMYDS